MNWVKKKRGKIEKNWGVLRTFLGAFSGNTKNVFSLCLGFITYVVNLLDQRSGLLKNPITQVRNIKDLKNSRKMVNVLNTQFPASSGRV